MTTFELCGVYFEMLWDVESDKYRYRNARHEGMKKLLEEINIEGLTADCVRRKINMIKTVYSQEMNRIMLSKNDA
jgi:hypothetical protein